MYFFLVFAILIIAITVHAVSEFRKKAIRTGEAELSITAKNILPASKVCKVCSAVTFSIMLLTGILMLAESSYENWNLFSISSTVWKELHVTISILFFLLFALHLYTHSGWIKHKVIHK